MHWQSDLPATNVAAALHLMSVCCRSEHRQRQVALFPSLGQRCSSSFVQNNPSGQRMPQGEAAFLKNNKKMSFLLFTISFCYIVFPMLGLCGIRTTCIIHDANAKNELLHAKIYNNIVLIPPFFSYSCAFYIDPQRVSVKPTQKRKYIISRQTACFIDRVTSLLLISTASQLSYVATHVLDCLSTNT